MFTPKWKKDAHLLAKGARKFVHYKRDLLKPDRIDEIESRLDDLKAAVKSGDRAKTDEASKQLRATCEGALPFQEPQSWLEENVEVMFVAIVIALGLRAYFLQPFRIPTGSMQPTLNGIISKRMTKEEWPSFPKRMAEMALRGRSYVKIVNDRPRQIARRKTNDGREILDVRDVQVLHFFTRSDLCFTDGSTLRLPGPGNQIDILLRDCLEHARKNGDRLNAGDVVCEGYVDTGDLVLVDRLSYHFRKPNRGEVFVFDTRDLPGTRHPGEGVTHFIKRLCAVPGDKLSIQPPYLLIDGRITNEPGIRNVYENLTVRQDGLTLEGKTGYILADPRQPTARLLRPDDVMDLRNTGLPEYHEYAALGDNTGSSLDSRYWGPVRQYNLVGPGWFTLWPFATGHWGFIH